ncbi:hypothetical protein [Sporomusa sp.]|uniref:hypothetical protein n=1 Tax=Sporomusa sp. TaxID=2078658 RepID=UPI002CD364F3|nr:hypothetical protein [Sporomusa sp.]HWR42782.1 hypothetical protein [Sporomusa sp.]
MGEPGVNVIVERIENLKEHFNEKFINIEKKLDGQCEHCQNTPKFRERLHSQWFHITALWGALGAITSMLFYVAQRAGVIK